MNNLQQQLSDQQFTNEYQLVNGVAMHAENPDNFQIPPDVIKRHVRPGQFVELRIDSPIFSVQEDDAVKCTCPSCNGELTVHNIHRPELVAGMNEGELKELTQWLASLRGSEQ